MEQGALNVRGRLQSLRLVHSKCKACLRDRAPCDGVLRALGVLEEKGAQHGGDVFGCICPCLQLDVVLR